MYATEQVASRSMERSYERYLAALNRVLSAGGIDVEQMRPLVTSSKYQEDAEVAREYRQSKHRVVGTADVSDFRVQMVDLATGAGSAYACVDVSHTRIVDSKGRNITSPDRASVQSLVIKFKGRALVDGSDSWSGAMLC